MNSVPRPPLQFNAPAGWPKPPATWVARNQGWVPPSGWFPPTSERRYLAPAPAGWRFWSPDPIAWAELREPFTKSAKRAMLIGGLSFGTGSIVTILGYLGELGHSFFILYGAIIFGGIRFVTGLVNLGRADRNANAALLARSGQIRYQFDAADYPRYLAESEAERSRTGQPAMTLEQFQVARDSEPWSFTPETGTPGSAPTSPGYSQPSGFAPAQPGVPPVPVAPAPSAAPSYLQALPFAQPTAQPTYGQPAPFGQPSPYGQAGPYAATAGPWMPMEAPRGPALRKRFWIPLVALFVILLAAMIPSALAASHSASGTGTSTQADTSTNSGATSGNYTLSSTDWKVVDPGVCSSTSGCWQLEITPPTACAAATITWGFSSSETGADEATRTSSVSFVPGRVEPITIPVTPDLDGLDYIFLDGVNCAP